MFQVSSLAKKGGKPYSLNDARHENALVHHNRQEHTLYHDQQETLLRLGSSNLKSGKLLQRGSRAFVSFHNTNTALVPCIYSFSPDFRRDAHQSHFCQGPYILSVSDSRCDETLTYTHAVRRFERMSASGELSRLPFRVHGELCQVGRWSYSCRLRGRGCPLRAQAVVSCRCPCRRYRPPQSARIGGGKFGEADAGRGQPSSVVVRITLFSFFFPPPRRAITRYAGGD